jgi:hypothetical protein
MKDLETQVDTPEADNNRVVTRNWVGIAEGHPILWSEPILNALADPGFAVDYADFAARPI